MPNAKFTSRLSSALGRLQTDPSLRAVKCRSGSLFSPIYRAGKYVWVKVMDSDGLLVARRKVDEDGSSQPSSAVSLLLGVVFQSEDATSQTKPNPIGKAAISHVPNGIWVDLRDSSPGRRRLDRVLVVFVLPKGAAASRRAKFVIARRNVLNASDMMPDAVSVEVPRGANARAVAEVIRQEVRPFLVGRGRPRSRA